MLERTFARSHFVQWNYGGGHCGVMNDDMYLELDIQRVLLNTAMLEPTFAMSHVVQFNSKPSLGLTVIMVPDIVVS